MAGRKSMRRIELFDPASEETSLDDIERITIHVASIVTRDPEIQAKHLAYCNAAMSPDSDPNPMAVGRSISRPSWGTMLAVAAVYFGAAKLGLTMAFVAEQVTVVWPPSGIALATVILFGRRV